MPREASTEVSGKAIAKQMNAPSGTRKVATVPLGASVISARSLANSAYSGESSGK